MDYYPTRCLALTWRTRHSPRSALVVSHLSILSHPDIYSLTNLYVDLTVECYNTSLGQDKCPPLYSMHHILKGLRHDADMDDL